MSAYAVVVVVALAALAVRGFEATAAAVGVGIVVVGGAFDLSYLIRRRADRALPHRRALDRVVRWQWLGIGLAGLGAAITLSAIGPPLEHPPRIVQTLIVGLSVAAPAIFNRASSIGTGSCPRSPAWLAWRHVNASEESDSPASPRSGTSTALQQQRS